MIESLLLPPKMQRTLEEDSVTDLLINGNKSIFTDRQKEGLKKESLRLDWCKSDVIRWLTTLLSEQNRGWDAKAPFVDIMKGDFRVHVLLSPLSEEDFLISIRKRNSGNGTPDARWLHNKNEFKFLRSAIQSRHSVLVSGATGSGKSTLTQDLVEQIPHDERIVCIEDTPELSPRHPHFVSLRTRNANADGYGEVTATELIRQSLRMRPDRLILGECRGEEVLQLLQILNTGHTGTISTIHANSARDALQRLELLTLLASNGSIGVRVIRELISRGIRWIVQLEHKDGFRKISEISEIAGREGDTILLREVLKGSSWPHHKNHESKSIRARFG